MKRYQWLLLGFILLAALWVRLTVFREPASQLRMQRPIVDAAWHDWWAHGEAFGLWNPPKGQPDPEIASHAYFKPPGYPWFLGAIYRIAGDTPNAPRVVQTGLGLGTLFLTFLLASRLFGARAGLLAAVLLAGCPLMVWYDGELLEVSLSAFLGLSLAHAVWMSSRCHSSGWALSSGLFAGAAVVVRPNAFLWIPFILWWWGKYSREEAWSQLVMRMAWLLIGASLFIGPVMARNWMIEHEPVFISANAGLNLALGNHAQADGASPVGPGFQRWSSFEYPQRIRALWPNETVGYAEASRRFSRQAMEWGFEHPWEFLRLLGRKCLLLIGPRDVENAGNRVEEFEISESSVLSRMPIGFSVLLGLSLAGFLLPGKFRGDDGADRSGSESVSLVGGLVVVWLVSFLPFFVAARFRAPILPFLAVLAGSGIDSLAQAIMAFGDGVFERSDARHTALALVVAASLAVPNWAGFVPGMAEGWFQRGVDLTVIGDMNLSREAYLKAISLEPRHAWANNNLGSLLLQSGNEEEAMKRFQVAADSGSDCPEGLYNLGVLLGRRKSWDGSFAVLSVYVRLVPERSDGWYNLGLAAMGRGQFEQAEAAYGQAIRLASGDAEIHNNLAVVLTLQGKFPQAWREIISCRELGLEPDSALVQTIRSNLK